MPSFENPMKKLLRTDRDLQLLKNVRKFVRADGTFSGGGGAITVVQPLQWKLPPATALTLSANVAGAITVTQSHHTVDTNAAAATGDLATINGLVANQLYVLRPANDGRTIVVKNGTGNIDCIGGADISLDDIEDWCWVLSPDGVRAYVMCDTQGAGGGGAHNHTTADGSGVLTNPEFDGYSNIIAIATPSSPSAGAIRLFARTSGNNIELVMLSATGAECVLCSIVSIAHTNTLAANWIQ